MNKNKFIPFVIGGAVILIALIIVFVQGSQKTAEPYKPAPNGGGVIQGNTNTTNSPKTYTLADVSKHSSQASCWTAVNNIVYDVTSWITKHPGGDKAILSLCGKDESAAFNGQHGGQPKPEAVLVNFKIGTLIK